MFLATEGPDGKHSSRYSVFCVNFAYFWPTSGVVFAHFMSSKIEFRPMGQHPFFSGPVRKDHVWPKTVRKVNACSYLFHLVTIPLQIGYHQHTMALRP